MDVGDWLVILLLGLFIWLMVLVLKRIIDTIKSFFGKYKQSSQQESEVVYLDLETTGLDAVNDEIVEIAIIDDFGKTLLHSYVKPERKKRWPKAEAIHGISPKKVKNAPFYRDIESDIRNICSGKYLVIYNAKFDTKFIKDAISEVEDVYCAMLRYAEYKNIPNRYGNGYKWHKLEAAAKEARYKWKGKAHSALADTLATRAVWHYLDKKRAVIRPV